jgi:RNA-directed DNA polymerase
MSLFEQVGSVIRPVDFGDAGSGSETHEEQQAFTAVDQQRALTQDLMERVVLPSNLNTAYKRVKANKGSAGIDGMTVETAEPMAGPTQRAVDRAVGNRDVQTPAD